MLRCSPDPKFFQSFFTVHFSEPADAVRQTILESRPPLYDDMIVESILAGNMETNRASVAVDRAILEWVIYG